MPFIIKNLIPENQIPVTVTEDKSAQLALSLMIEHDFSQLPVVDDGENFRGMITSDSILQAVSYFKATPENLKVSHATVKVKTYRDEDDLSALLKDLQDINAIPIVDNQGTIQAIITSYDTAVFFRRHAEDIMLAEDIETTLRDFIESAHKNDAGELDDDALSHTIQAITPSNKDLKDKFKSALLSYIAKTTNSNPSPDNSTLDAVFSKHLEQPVTPKNFDELTLYDFIQIFRKLWPQHSANFKAMAWDAINHLLDDVRQTRNAIAHFREVTPQQRKQLQFCAAFLERHRPIFEVADEELATPSKLTPQIQAVAENMPVSEVLETISSEASNFNPVDEEIAANESRYAPLAIWLQSQDVDRIACTFKEIETLINDELPASARQHRNWWANDSVSHTQSIQWLDAGWRVSSVNMSTERVVFSRMGDRQSAYISFFNQLQAKLQSIESLAIKSANNPQGRHWFVILVGSKNGTVYKPPWIIFSFARKSRFRIETYINERTQKHNKQIFDQLYAQKAEIEAEFGEALSWERLDDKHGSRIAYYRPNSSITDSPEKLTQIQDWAIEVLPKFYAVLTERFLAAHSQVIAMTKVETHDSASGSSSDIS